MLAIFRLAIPPMIIDQELDYIVMATQRCVQECHAIVQNHTSNVALAQEELHHIDASIPTRHLQGVDMGRIKARHRHGP